MDLATLIGVTAAFGLTLMAIFMGSGLGLFIDVPSMLIVLGGTIGVTLVNYPLKEITGIVNVAKKAVFARPQSSEDIIQQLVEFSQVTRREGILALQSKADTLEDPFLKKGITLAIDGLEPDVINTILDTELQFIEERHTQGADIFTTMGSFAPAFGMIGTLIGLVQMLAKMDDPKAIGPAMAVALITTFYGSVLANIVFIPVAGKLKARSREELLIKQLVMEGIRSIQAGDNPRIVESKLHAFIAPKLRSSRFSN